MERALIIVSSPFQVLCAIEAIHHFDIQKYRVLLVYSNEKLAEMNAGAAELLNKHHIQFEKIILGNYLMTLLFSVIMKSRYSSVIVGDYFDLYQKMIASYAISRGASLIYVDDGNSTYAIADPSLKTFGRKYKIKRMIPAFLAKTKNVREELFTLFNCSPSQIKVHQNGFSSLKASSSGTPAGVYIIGTESSYFNPILKKQSYEDYLNALKFYIDKNYPGQTVYYCPHRKDMNSENVKKTCGVCGFRIYDTQIAVEPDFISRNVNPCCIIGFGSSALLTLKNIYPDCPISTIRLNLTSDKLSKEYKFIEDQYEREGIGILDYETLKTSK